MDLAVSCPRKQAKLLSSLTIQSSVNLTEVSVPNATILDYDDTKLIGSNAHLLGTTFDLQWPNKSMSLNETIAALNTELGSYVHEPFCAVYLGNYAYPNVTNSYTDSDSSGCEDVIPTSCLEHIMNAVSEMDESCSLPFSLRGEIEACEDSFHLEPFPYTQNNGA